MNFDIIKIYPKSIEDLFELFNKNIDISEMVFDFEAKSQNNQFFTENYIISGKFDLKGFSNIFVLVSGGWLPLKLVQVQNFFLDRNIISKIKSMQGKYIENRYQSECQELKFLNSDKITLNVLLHAIESEHQRNPTFKEFCDSVAENGREIKHFLPNVNIFEFNDDHLKKAYDIINKYEVKFYNNISFFLDISKVLLQKCGVGAEQKVLDILIESAKKYSISLSSFSFYAAISCLYEDIHGDVFSIGRKLIKPKEQFTITDAYNVAADIRHIELTSTFQALGELRVVNLITKDKALAALWSATNPFGTINENSFKIRFHLHKLLLPRLTEEDFKRLINELVKNI